MNSRAKKDEAINIIRNSDSTFEQCVEASGVIAQSESVSYGDLLECLKRRGLPAEIAAMKLYKKTKRLGPRTPQEFVAGYEDWSNYLKQTGFLADS